MYKVRNGLARYLILAAAAVCWAGGAYGQEGSRKTLADKTYERVLKATVEILVNGHLAGSGWFADGSGAVVTAAHVVESPNARVELLTSAGERLPAEFVAVDLSVDAALLHAPTRETGYPFLSFDEDMPPVASVLYLLGTPQFRHQVLTTGSIAAESTAYEYVTGHYLQVIYMSAHATKGFSGGPWFTARGRVVGMQSGHMSLNNAQAGIAFMTPAAPIARLLARRENARTATLGISCEEVWEQAPAFLKRLPQGTEGAVIRAVDDDGPADHAGLHPWDTIIGINGQTVRFRDDLLSVVRAHVPGDTVELRVLHPDGAGNSAVDVVLGWLEVAWTARDEDE